MYNLNKQDINGFENYSTNFTFGKKKEDLDEEIEFNNKI